jgi:hypothetical protein
MRPPSGLRPDDRDADDQRQRQRRACPSSGASRRRWSASPRRWRRPSTRVQPSQHRGRPQGRAGVRADQDGRSTSTCPTRSASSPRRCCATPRSGLRRRVPAVGRPTPTAQGIDERVVPLLVVQIPNRAAGESESEKGRKDEEALILRVLNDHPGGLAGAARRTASRTCSARAAGRSVWVRLRHPARRAARLVQREDVTSACSSPRTRSRPAGTARGPRCCCLAASGQGPDVRHPADRTHGAHAAGTSPPAWTGSTAQPRPTCRSSTSTTTQAPWSTSCWASPSKGSGKGSSTALVHQGAAQAGDARSATRKIPGGRRRR